MKSYSAIRSLTNPVVGNVYGNVSYLEGRMDDESPVSVIPISIYIGKRPCRWGPVVKILTEWEDFIWSDDGFPWFSERAAKALIASGLTGIKLTETFLHYVDDNDVSARQRAKAPMIYRGVFLPPSPEADFYEELQGEVWLWASDEAVRWISERDWKNFEVVENGVL